MASDMFSDNNLPSGAGFHRLMVCLVYLAAVSVAVILSPAAGLVEPRSGSLNRTASLAP